MCTRIDLIFTYEIKLIVYLFLFSFSLSCNLHDIYVWQTVKTVSDNKNTWPTLLFLCFLPSVYLTKSVIEFSTPFIKHNSDESKKLTPRGGWVLLSGKLRKRKKASQEATSLLQPFFKSFSKSDTINNRSVRIFFYVFMQFSCMTKWKEVGCVFVILHVCISCWFACFTLHYSHWTKQFRIGLI